MKTCCFVLYCLYCYKHVLVISYIDIMQNNFSISKNKSERCNL